MQKITRTILFLVPYPRGLAPSQRFRFEHYLDDIEKLGYALEFHSFLANEDWAILYQPGYFIKKLFLIIRGFWRRLGLFFGPIQRADRVFIHREVAPVGPPIFEWLIVAAFRKRVIYDFDDAIWLPNTSEENRIVSKLKWHSKVGHICRWSQTVSAGNEYLAQYARGFNANVVINPTTVDPERVHVPASGNTRKSQEVCIGWTGTHSTLKYLNGIRSVLLRLEKHHGSRVRFIVIADRAPELGLRNLTFLPWSGKSEIEDLRLLDIGVMPLQDDQWTRGKCGLKIIQYMSLAIPSVASPVGVNSDVIKDGENGFLCQTAEQWYDRLNMLIEDESLRTRMGAAGRARIRSAYSTGSNRSSFLALFR